jgi:flagellar protein FlgJ
MKVPELNYPADQVSSIYDLKDLDRLRSRTQNNDKAALRQVAQKFESIFVSMLLKSMRDANQHFEKDNMLQSNNTKFYRDMHDQQMAQDLGSHGAFGLAELIVQQLDPDYDKFKPASLMIGPREYKSSKLQMTHQEEAKPTPLFSSKHDFLMKIKPLAIQAAKTLQIKPELLMAQAAVETDWGSKILHNQQGQPSLNIFNLKADPKWQGQTVKRNPYQAQVENPQTATPMKMYEDLPSAFGDYINFIQSKPQAKQALHTTKQPMAYLKALELIDFRTDPDYAKRVLRTMARILDN